jgi:hypothetical protein
MEIEDTLSFLLGTWALRREIDDRRSGILGTFTGRAEIAGERRYDGAATLRARYEETGELRFGSRTGPAHRRLYCVRLPSRSVVLTFIDGREFIELDLRSGRSQASHVCGADRYEIATRILCDGALEERWRVRGPQKDYDALTTLVRQSAG